GLAQRGAPDHSWEQDHVQPCRNLQELPDPYTVSRPGGVFVVDGSKPVPTLPPYPSGTESNSCLLRQSLTCRQITTASAARAGGCPSPHQPSDHSGRARADSRRSKW